MKLSLIPLTFLSFLTGTLEQGRLSIETSIGRTEFQVEIASSSLSQIRGLMNRDRLTDKAGMLFVYPEDRYVKFWMKNVSFPLDMLFLDRCGVVLSLHGNAAAFDETIILPDHKLRMVLEVRGGASKRAHIRPGHQFDLTDLNGSLDLVGLPEAFMLQQDQLVARPLPCLN